MSSHGSFNDVGGATSTLEGPPIEAPDDEHEPRSRSHELTSKSVWSW